ncbi:hypothetical protein HYC85_027750 [Camellia sinensis]|uniref:Uncharacterized protein n=1 Tax=Camellia sinensis TaxID=4442 RepID=A0A7J7FTF8_CAMSI|nr:hypothetical protein HYC85_027750 [Camellia sinensis]
MAGRPSRVSVGQIFGRWQQNTAGGLKPWPVECGDVSQAIPCPPKQNTSVWCKTRHKTVESRDPEAGRVAETSGNSGRTRTRMITECSNSDVQVLRTVKNGVSTPGFEIFFDLQLSGDEVAKEQTDPLAEAEQFQEEDSESTEIEMGVALACLLSDPQIVPECLGDNFLVFMIGVEAIVGPFSSILDASIAPSLVWQYGEGFLSSSFGSGSELEFDSTESVESESDSGSVESESGIPGGDNPDATVLSRSSFSFFFESIVTEELDDLEVANENSAVVAFEYFSVPLVYCINQDFQNFDENNEEEIPPILKHLIDREQERLVKPLVDKITSINVGTEKDPRLVQIGPTLSSEERERLVTLLKDFKDVFAWSYEDMPEIDPEIVQHRIPLDLEA